MEKVKTTINIPRELYEKMKSESKERGISFNGYLISKLWDLFKERK